jgi:hypothetical protein
MSNKKKIHDLNDIIDTAYTAADYSHGNGYYDKAGEHNNIKANRSFTQSNAQSRFGSTNNDTFRNDSSNIFMKNSQSNVNNTSSDKSESQKIELNYDNFPSLGSKTIQPVKISNTNPNTNTNITNSKLDFKKIVEKRPEVVSKPEPKINHMQSNRFKYNQHSLYNEIKVNSEKIAQLKIMNDVSSDDNMDDNYY